MPVARDRVFVFDGGGVRGAMSLAAYMASTTGLPPLPSVWAGTSIGGVMAIALAQRVRPEALMHVFSAQCSTIFKPRFLGGIWRAKYSDSRRNVFSQVIHSQLSSDDPWLVRVTPLSGTGFEAIYASQSDVPNFNPVDAAMATSAAPTFFPSFKGYVDGALVQNSPIRAAILFAERLHPGTVHEVYSYGTGFCPAEPPSHRDWGALQWAPKIADAFLAADADEEIYNLAEMPSIRYQLKRYNRDLPKPVALDDYHSIPELIAWGREMTKPQTTVTRD